MKNFKNVAKKLVAVVIALTLLMGMCLTAAVPATASTGTTYADGKVPATDENLRYLGHWAESDGSMKGYFQSTVEIKFTGTSLAIDFDASGSIAVSVDGGDYSYFTAGDNVVLASGLNAGDHKAVITAKFQHSYPVINGFTIDAGAQVLEPDTNKNIAFIGDSITLGYFGAVDGYDHSFVNAYGTKVAANLGWAVNTTAIGGIGIAEANTGIDTMGMVDRYFRLGENGSDAADVEFDTSIYAPDYIVVALGTNGSTANASVQAAYEGFLTNLRTAYPDATIICLTPFQSTGLSKIPRKISLIEQSVASRNNAGDNNVYFIDSTNWITDAASQTTDGVHPTYDTQALIASNLTAEIQKILDDPNPAEGDITNEYAKDLTVVATTQTDRFTYSTSSGTVQRNGTSFTYMNDVIGGGVKVGWDSLSGYSPYALNANLGAFPGNGFTLKFSDYNISSTDTSLSRYGQIAIAIANASEYKLKMDVPFLQIDTVNGALYLSHCNDASFGVYEGYTVAQTIIESDVLSYANIKGKPFTVSVDPADSGNYLITVDVDGTVVTGEMDAEIYSAYAKAATTATYISVGGMDNSNASAPWSINFYGYKAHAETYAPLDIDSSLRNSINVLATKSADAGASALGKRVLNVQNGGVRIKYAKNALTAPYVFTSNLGAFPGYGITLQFANYVNNATDTSAAGYGQIAIALSSTTVGVEGLQNVPFLQIDTVNGKLLLAHGADGAFVTDATIITNDILKDLTGKAFSITIAKDYTVTVKVGDATATGTLDVSLVNAVANHPTELATYVAVSGLDDTSAFDVSFYGYRLEASGLAEGLTGVASAELDYIKVSYKKVTDLTGGGVNIKFTNYGCYEPYHYPVNMGDFNGIDLQFSNYYSYNTNDALLGHGKLLIMLSNESAGSTSRGSNAIKFKPEVVGVLINTVSGTLELVENNDEQMSSYTVIATLATNDALKYANFSGKEFVVSFDKSDNGVVVTVTVDGTAVSGTATTEQLANFKYCPDNTATYVSVGSTENSNNGNTWSVNFYGYKKDITTASNAQVAGGTVENLINTIDSIPDTVTLDDANLILTAKALYDAFGATAREQVTNANDLTLAYNTLVNLQNAAVYKPTAAYLAGYPEYTDQYPNAGLRTMYAVATDDGFKVDFDRTSTSDTTDVQRNTTLTGKYALDGLYVSFKNFNYTLQSDFYVAFTSGEAGSVWDGSADAAKEQLVLYLGTDSTNLMLAGAGMTTPVSLGANSILKRSNLVGKDISIEWHAATNGDYYVYITVGSQVAGYRVSAEQIAAATNLDVDAVRVMVASPAIGNDFEIEVDGIYAETSSTVKAVIDAIAALNADSTASQINTAYNSYMALSVADKQLVINYPVLNELRLALRTVDENGFDAEGYYVPTMDDIYDNSPTQKALAVTAAANGGIKIDMNNSIFGLRTVLKDRYVAEDITLRFDNYNYNNGGLIVGLTSSVDIGAIFNKTGSAGRFGMFFLIGYDSSVWVSAPYVENTMYKILTDDVLSTDSLQNNQIIVNIKYDPDTNRVTFTIRVGGKTLSYDLDNLGRLPVTNGYYSEAMDQFNYENAQIVIESVAGYNPETGIIDASVAAASSIEFTGMQYMEQSSAQQEKIDAVIAAIDALPNTPSLDIEDDVTAVWNQYFELALLKMRAAVTNYDKLLTLHDGIFNLKAGNSNVTAYVDKDIASATIDNSSLVTPYVEDSKVNYDSTGIWPEWTKDLVMAEVNLKNASAGGTILASDIEPMLKHLAETGVNGLWVLPIHDEGADNTSIYCNYGPHTISPYLTGVLPYGTDYSKFDGDYTQAFANFKAFVDLAHSYNIRIFIDIVPWGVSKLSPVYANNADWFEGESSWGGMDYKLDNTEVQTWFKDSVVKTYLATGVDGIRWDLEPNYFGYDLVKEVLNELKAEGKKPLFFSEDQNGRNGAYAFEQCYGVIGKGVGSQTVSEVFFKDIDIVEAIKTGSNIGVKAIPENSATNGTAKYYAYQISSHDVIGYHNASLASWAYEYAFSSFIPIFYLGDEWNSSHTGGLTGVTIGWDELEEADHAEYYEAVKKLIGLRWMYKDMLNSNVDDHTQTNICSVDVIGTDHVKGYARYADNEAIVVVPNVNERSTADATFTVELPIADMGLSKYSYYTVTDMLTGDMVTSGTAADITYFSETIEHNTAGVYLVSGNTSDVTWSMSEDGTLTISGTGAVTDTPWAAAYSTATKVVIEEGVTSVPADAFTNFGGVKEIVLPESMTELPVLTDCAADVKIVIAQGAAIESAVAASGYNYVYSSLTDDGVIAFYEQGYFANTDALDVTVASDEEVAAIFGSANADMYKIGFTPAYDMTVKLPIASTMNAENVAVYAVDAYGNASVVGSTVVDGYALVTTDMAISYAVVELAAEYAEAFEIKTINVKVAEASKIVEVVVDSKYLTMFNNLTVQYATAGSASLNSQSSYTTVGNDLVFTIEISGDVIEVRLTGDYHLGDLYTSDMVKVDLARMDGAVGTKYVQYINLIGGDANGDGATNIKDLVRTKKIIAGTKTATDGADLNGDGSVVTTDLTLLAKLIVNGKKGMEAFTVTFADYDGTIHEVINVPAGFKAIPTVTPEKDGNALTEWKGDLSNITADVTIYAVYENSAESDFSEDDMSGTIPEDWEYDE